jgi:hypothetical protein
LLQEWELPGTEQEGILFHNGALYVGEDYGGASTGRVIRYAPFSLPVITPPMPSVNPGDTRVITSSSAHLGVLSLFAVTVGHRATVVKQNVVKRKRSRRFSSRTLA